MWRDKSHRKSQRGYTVTELTLVLAVGMTLLFIAVPMVDFLLNQYNLTLSAEGIAAQLQYARLRAISSNEASRLRFPDANTYRVESEDGTVIAGPFAFPRGVGLNTVDGGDPVTFPGDQVLFLPNGTLPILGDGSAGRVKLANGSGRKIDILVDGGGLVRKTPTYRTTTSPY